MGTAQRRRFERLEREESLEERVDRATSTDASSPDLLDVPAAVVCAFCGEADCAGCNERSDLSRSGIVSVIAWERPATPTLTRLWSTARSSTRDAEKFFELLPDGPLLPALRFAAACELLASAAALTSLLIVMALVAPEWLKHVALDPSLRSLALRSLVFGLPAFAAMLVMAHVAHGLSIDIGAVRSGARSARSRALRFGLYACGWDLVMGPLGAVVVAVKEGLRASLSLGTTLSGLPTRATKAFLRGCYRLEGPHAHRALGASYFAAIVATMAFAAIVLVAGVALLLA